MADFRNALERPLGFLALDSDLHADAEVLSALDGALNLLRKAETALGSGTPDDHARASDLLDRAERHLERCVAQTTVTDDVRHHLDGVRSLILRHRSVLARDAHK